MITEAREHERLLAARVVYEIVRRKGFSEVWNDTDQDIRNEIGQSVEKILRRQVD